ncbi:MAG: YceI family protein [Bacteroidetes bacterium]|nr:MAG: YceI family protein [Bacteroidota bacterium]
MTKVLFTYLLIFPYFMAFAQDKPSEIYKTEIGNVVFKSDAPLELISSVSNELKGIIDSQKRTFIFQVKVVSLKGFNSKLQQEHFYENYMEIDKFPHMRFKGKLVEHIDFAEEGEFPVRAKGIFSIHGIEKEEIIKATIIIGKNKIIIHSEFQISLEDYNIKIPHVVFQKIAEEIDVSIDVELLNE